MKNKILLIGTIGFMAIISVPVFSQTVAPVNQGSAGTQPVPSKIITPSSSVNKQSIKPAPATQSVHSTTNNNLAVPSKVIQPTTAGGKNQVLKPAASSTNAASTTTVKQTFNKKFIQPSSTAKTTGTTTATNSTTNIH
jgi:hypothetical protein